MTEEDHVKTPYQVWVGKKPDLGHVRAFGEVGCEQVPKKFTRKFDARTKKVILMGYDGESTKYRLYQLDTKKVTVSRSVIFREYINGESYSSETSDGEDWLEAIENEQLIEQRDGNAEQRVKDAAQPDGNIEQQGDDRNDVAEPAVGDAEGASPVGIAESVVQVENAAVPTNYPFRLRDRAQLRIPGWAFGYELDFA